jgi:hypothetical protein
LITERAYQQQAAMNAIAQAFMDNKINADTAASAVGSVANQITGLDGLSANVYVDVWITQHGASAYLGPMANTTTSNKAIDKLRASTGGGRAAGGPLNGELTQVGEEGWEYIVKDRSGGFTVIPHEVSMWMAAAGIAPDNQAAVGIVSGPMSRVGTRMGSSALKVGSGGRTASNNLFFAPSSSSSGGGGGGGGAATSSEVAETVASAVADVTPTIANTVVTAVGATLAQAPQLQAISESVDEIKRINENLITLISKTASAGDIGRAVKGAQALAA